MQKKEIYEFIDVAKGIGIILVVAGHVFFDGKIHGIIYLFHMPLFFIISGYLLEPVEFKTFFKRKVRSLIIPYVSYLILIGVPVAALVPNGHERGFLVEFLSFLYGGQHLVTYMTVFWFVTCLFFSILLYQFFLNVFRNVFNFGFVATIFCLLCISYLIAWLVRIPTPLAIGVIPIASVYLYIGNAYRHSYISKNFVIFACISVVMIIYFLYGTFPFFEIDIISLSR